MTGRAVHVVALALLAALLAAPAVHALSEGPPGATTGDRGDAFVGLALSPEAQLLTGAATTGITLEVPPGRNAMAPNLRLAYSSHGAPGPYGVGWDVPLGRIERSTRAGVPRYGPGDVFVVVLPDGVGELVPLGGNDFAMRLDEAHVAVTADPPANRWVLHDRSGRDYVFGAAPASRIGPDASRFDGTFAWYLTRVRDPNGNTIDVAWSTLDAVGVVHPWSILYGGNERGLPHVFEVAFRWRATPGSRRISWAAGFRQEDGAVLESVTVSAGAELVRRWEVDVRPSAGSGRPLLTQVTLRGADWTPLPNPARFAYHELAGPGFAEPRSVELFVGDFRDGDGCTQRDFVDLNGDGRPDLVQAGFWTAADPHWVVRLNQGRDAPAFFGDGIRWRAPRRCLTEQPQGSNATVAALVDMDGDALVDYVDATAHPWRVYRNTGTGFAATPASWPLAGHPENIRNGDPVSGGIVKDLVDLNGDGRPDAVYTADWTPDDRHWAVRWNLGTGFSAKERIRAPHGYVRVGGRGTPSRNIQSDLFDLNGDGLPDKVSAVGNPDGDGWHWNVWYGTGRGFAGRDGGTEPERWASPPRTFLRSWDPFDRSYRHDVFDVNGDGLPDFVDAVDWSPAHRTWIVYRNTGRGFAAGHPVPAPEAIRRRHPDVTTLGFSSDTLDLDGNGYPDVVVLPGDGRSVAQVWLARPEPAAPDTLLAVTDGFGSVTLFSYDVSTAFDDGDVDPALHDGHPHLPFPVHVVREVLRLDPADPAASLRTRYRYRGGWFDGARREFRGFHRVWSTDDFGMTVERRFHQREPLRGKTAFEQTFARDPAAGGDPGLLSQTWSLWECETSADCAAPDAPGPRWFPRLASTARVEYGSPVDVPWSGTAGVRSLVTRRAYDACGNVVREEAVDDDGAAVASEAAYAGCAADRVCRGRCDRATMTRVAGGLEKRFEYDAAGNLVASVAVGPGSPTTRLAYDGWGNVTAVTSPRGRVTTFAYDATALHPVEVVADATGLAHRTTYAHDLRFGKVVRRTEPSGATTEFAYDAFGRLAAVADPGQTLARPGRRVQYVVGHGEAVVTERLEPLPTPHYEVTVAFADAFGRPLQVQETRRVLGVPRTVVTGATVYGPGGRVLRTHAPWVTTGDPRTRAAVPPTHPATVPAYDEFGRTLAVVNPDGTVLGRSYRVPRVERRCDARHGDDPSTGACVEEERDGFGRVIARRTYHGLAVIPYASETRTYDSAGRVTRVRQNDDPATDVVTTYDALGRKTSVVDPDSGTWRFGWDVAGNLVWRDDPEPGRSVETEYDALDRPLRRWARAADQPGEGAATLVAEYTWDAAAGGVGRLARVVDRSGELAIHAYDARGNPLRTTRVVRFADVSRSFTTENRWDPLTGRLVATTVPYPNAGGAETLSYDYAADGTPVGLRAEHGTYVADVLYDELGRVAGATYGNGVREAFAYHDAAGMHRLWEIATQDRWGTPLRAVLYQRYDANGQVVATRDLLHRARRPQSATLFAEYDDASRLVRAVQCGAGGWDGRFAGDAYGNVAEKDGVVYEYGEPNRPHRPTAVGGEPVEYDADGNMVRLPGDRRLGWDAEGRLVAVRRGDALVAEYVYDHEGVRRAARTPDGITFFFDGFDVRDGTVVRHLRLGDRIVASSPVAAGAAVAARATGPARAVARTLAGSVLVVLLGAAFAVPGRRRLGPLGRARRGAVLVVVTAFFASDLALPSLAAAQCDPTPGVLPPGTFFHHVDHLGSPRLLTDRDGAVLEYLVDRPWGAAGGAFDADGASLPDSRSAFRFTGHRGDDGTGLLYFGARYYDPALGMFVSHDPARQFMSPYGYGDGNPLNGRDPSGAFFGLDDLFVALLIGAVVGAAVAAFQAAVRGLPLSQGLRSVATGALMGAVSGAAFGFVGAAVDESVNVTLQLVYELALVGSATYQAVQSLRAGDVVSGLAAIVSAARSLANAAGALTGSTDGSARTPDEVGGPPRDVPGREPIDAQLPSEGPGFTAAMSREQHYGTRSTIELIRDVGAQWAHLYPDGPRLRITAISAKGGGRISRSVSHRTGVDFDVGIPRSDGLEQRVTIFDASYSRPMTQHLVTRLMATGRVQVVFFNDPVIRGVTYWQGHDDHLHVRLR